MQRKKTSPQFFIIIFFTAIIVSCTEETPLFQRVPSGVSGIDLHNIIVENDSVNQLDNEMFIMALGWQLLILTIMDCRIFI